MKNSITLDEFIKRSNQIHNNKYDYSNIKQIDRKIGKVDIICPEHGVFKQNPYLHMLGKGCHKCKGGVKYTLDDFLKISKNVHGDKYDYSNVDYKNSQTKVKIICPIHGEFEQIPRHHHEKHGCPKCVGLDKMTRDRFIERSNIIHKNKYDYDLVDYRNNRTKVKIICPNHGEFEQIPKHHLNGVGCPKCRQSKGENKIKDLLDLNKIKYIQQKRFKDCLHKQQLVFDFYLPELNICIEFDGVQHKKPIKGWGGEDKFKIRLLRDKIKDDYCFNNNIKLIRIDDIKSIDNVINLLQF